MQSLRGLKLIHRLLTALYRRTIALLLHCLKHPIKTIFFIIKAYLLLMLLALCLAFSFGSFAQDATEQYVCLDGGILTDYNGQMICYEGSPSGELYKFDYGQKKSSHAKACDSAAAGLASSYQNTPTIRYSNGGGTLTYGSDPARPSCAMRLNFSVIVNDGTGQNWNDGYHTHTDTTIEIYPGENYCPPDTSPEFNIMGDLNGIKICYKAADAPPCDCSDLTGSNPQGINYFYATPGVYSQATPPNCINRDDNEQSALPNCDCKIIATKWASAEVNINGTMYERWQPVPDQNGVTGVFTGGQCDAAEKDTPPDEPERCYQLGNGQNFCLEDPDTKCARIDGILTCDSGCGTVNGEFFCFEDNTDPDNQTPDEPNDTITDPDKTMGDMIKSDFKDVLGGTESRLDILASVLRNVNDDNNKNDSLIQSKLDATNRLLKEISDELKEQGEEEEETPTNPQPDYNTDKLEEFVAPNNWSEKNFRTVATAFKERMLQTPVMQAIHGFFDVALSSTCPTWQTTVEMPFGGSLDINIDQFCSDAMAGIWPYIRAIIILVFTFLAFRVAFTNE